MKSLKDINDWSDVFEHQMLGEILMQADKLNLIHLGMALDIQRFESLRLGEILLNMKVVTKENIDDALNIQKLIDERLK